jgi:Soluble lytic murein transglycosylase and related regulatory proteins (some contain LysM/invasin domains)
MLFFYAPSGSTDVYKYVDKYGRVTYTDKHIGSNAVKLIKTWKGWVAQPRATLNSAGFKKNKLKFTPTVDYAADLYKLPKPLLHAVITAESAYNPSAVSIAGAVGLMQLMPETARRYGVKDRKDPYENIHGGSRYLRDLLAMFKNDLTLALAAYNAGENAVVKYGNRIPPYPETQSYVKKVISYYKEFSKQSG